MDIRRFSMGLEIPLLLVYFAIMMADPVNTNFILYRTCYVILQYNETDCAQMILNSSDNATKALEKLVQPYSNMIIMTSTLVGQILPAIMCLFIGAWSDKHGRREILLVTIAGTFLVYVIRFVVSMLPGASPWYLLIETVPVILSGGTATFIMIILCCITDTSTPENRGMKMAMFEVMVALGIFMGTISSSYVFAATNYTGVFAIAAICILVSWLHTFFFIKETVTNVSDIEGNPNIFSLQYIGDMFRTTFKQRQHYHRAILLISVLLLILFIMAVNNGSVMLQFMYLKFGWSFEKYTWYSSAHAILWIVGTFIGVYVLHKVLGVGEISLSFLGFLLMAVSYMILGVAVADWQVYLAAALRSMGGVISPMLRSLISKICGAEEVGKIFALTVSLESLAGILASPLYTLVYNSTISTFPGAFNFVSAGIYTFNLILVVVILSLKRMEQDVRYNIMDESNC